MCPIVVIYVDVYLLRLWDTRVFISVVSYFGTEGVREY